MIAQGDAIAHGAMAIEYALDKERAQLVKLNGLPDSIEPLAMWARMMQLQHQKMKDRNSPKPITLNALRFEISPAMEETAGWTMDDWQKLADDFMRTLDSIDYRPSKPSQKLRKTNVRNSQYVVSLHTDSKSGIPHLHIVANRIDNMGRTNDAHYIGERAAHAANLINEKRGWVQSMQRRSENIERIYNDCMAILKEMPCFDWGIYCRMVTEKGYHIQTKSDNQNKIRGYSIRMGNSIYKSSEIGTGRKLMPSTIEAT
ncbi:MAG: relaxase/mobilization nuclease domain-containing protein [Prevotellaceae bacterium]|nr:relaxase/mobilization nuclease domain-containing protein [Prevotellaceae bacterium]MDO4932926.1 relaxase/mobilization nuclease domain-containing protein [Prevotellaceae bacterium]